MTPTPIPRSLSLTQYGDLDISIIRTMPSGRRGTQTKIITEENFQQFLNFLSTRLSMSEQAYVVVPAIVDNPESDLVNLELVLEKFKTPVSSVFFFWSNTIFFPVSHLEIIVFIKFGGS